MRTMDVVEQLIPRGCIDPEMDVYQRIQACPKEMKNERARLLLDFLASQTQAFFWEFQAALGNTECRYLAVGHGDEQAFAQTVSVQELSLVSADEEDCPPAVVKLTSKLKERYRTMEGPALGAEADSRPVSLDEIKVNICLLSADKLDALIGCPAQKQPFAVSALNSKAASVVSLEDVFEKDENGRVNPRQVATGIAGSGKTMAFMLKAPYHWSHEDPSKACWQHIQLFFTINLAKPVWWKAQELKEVFGLSRFRLTEKEKDDVVGFICDRSEKVLLVADSMDEADVKDPSLLWDVLSGSCEDLPRLNVVICSRPCERTSLLSKYSLFHRRLEVVGFTKEKIGQFIGMFFRDDEEKAKELQAKLSEQVEVFSLMHTPLLATMICGLHQLNRMLPKTQTGVYEAAVLAMLEQSAKRTRHKAPSSIFAELSPPSLQAAVANLSKMAYEGLSKKQVIFTETEVKSAGCLGAPRLNLGFLSVSSGVNIPGQGEDVFTFRHHTIMEFFSAVHAVREYIRPGKKSVTELLKEHGTDGDYERFWPFVSGLLAGEECETLLSALAGLVDDNRELRLRGRYSLLLLRCHEECLTQLPNKESQAVSQTMKSVGLDCSFTHLGPSDAQAVSTAFCRYKAVVTSVNLSSTILDEFAMSAITTALLSSENLSTLQLDIFGSSAECASNFAKIIRQNKASLRNVCAPTYDHSVQIIAPAIMDCAEIDRLQIGSQSLTNASAPMVADILHHRQLEWFGLHGEIDEEGFKAITPRLQDMAAHLTRLDLYWTKLHGALLGSALSSLTNLNRISLVGNAVIDDDGLQRFVSRLQHLSALKRLLLFDMPLTWKSIATLERLQHRMISLVRCDISLERSSFSCPAEDPTTMLELTTMKFTEKEPYKPALYFFGLEITEQWTVSNDRGQCLYVLLHGRNRL